MTLPMVGLVRSYLKDQALKNRIKNYEDEFKDPEIMNAAKLAVMKINITYPPETCYTTSDSPQYLLILGTVLQLMTSESFLKGRNTLSVNDGASSINREGNLAIYQTLAIKVAEEFDMLLGILKINLNIADGWGE